MTPGSHLWAGGIAGAVSVTVFTMLHQVFINAIWWMFPIMLIAGVICGMTLAWCYSELVTRSSGRSWTEYITSFTLMFGLLAVASSIVYEPIITMQEVLESSGGNPVPMSETLGLMAIFTLSWAGLLTWRHSRGWRGFWVTAATTSVLMFLLGFNVSTMGLVEIPKEGWLLVAEFFGYLIALGATYGLSYQLAVRLTPTRPAAVEAYQASSAVRDHEDRDR